MSVLNGVNSRIYPLDCTCDGRWPYCPVCLIGLAIRLRIAHPNSLSIAILKRRIPRISGREAAILLEATKLYR